jgi:prepilin-type processing-associated H-X9-DG protein
MNKRSIFVLALVIFVVILLVVPALLKLRVGHSRDYCREHQRVIWSASQYYKILAAGQGAGDPPQELPALPPGTIPNLKLPVEERLSWYVGLLPHFDQKRYPAAEYADKFNLDEGWKKPAHLEVGKRRITILLCPAAPVLDLIEELSATQYVGIAGLAPDGAKKTATAAGAGAFRYDSPTLHTSFTDGLSETAMLGEVSIDLGGWVRGGRSTIRDLDMGKKPFVGTGGQFGGLHPGGMNLLFADGSSRFQTERISPFVLQNLVTLNGGDAPALPD